MKINNFWYGKKVFITGINGFIGGNLANKLVEKGANVFGLVRNQRKDSFLWFENITDKTVLIQGDLIDKELISRILSEEQINIIFHLAAQVEVGVGIKNPYLTFETNVRGTYTLLESIRLFPDSIKAAVIASSDKAYGSYSKDKMPYKENYPLIPEYPYDTSKACADMIAHAYASGPYNLPVVITRFSNIYGPGQLNFSALIPDAVTSALGYSKFIPRGDGSMIRDFLYVEDVASLYLNIAESLARDPKKISGEVFNAGTNTPTSVRTVIENIFTLTNNEKDLQAILTAMKGKKTNGEINCQYMDYEKVNKFFGWSPKHNFESGIKITIDWYKKYNKRRFE